MKCPLGISSFLKEISGLSILLFSSISLHCLLAKALLPFLALLWNSAFSWVYLSPSPFPFASLFSSVCKISTPQISTLPSYISFPWGWFWSPPPVQCYALQVDSLPAEPQGKPRNSGMGSLTPSPADLPDPGIKPQSSAFQAYSSCSKNLRVKSYSEQY